MKKIIFALSVIVSATAAWAQPARVPINEPSSGNTNTKPTNTNQTNTGGSNTGSSSEMNKYSDPSGRFTIGYPGDWKFNSSPEDAVIQITSPKETDDDNFKQNVNLQIETVNSMTIETYVKNNIDAVKDIIKDYKEISSMYFTRNGSKAYQVIYKGKYEGLSYAMQIKQLFMLSNGKAYILTYVCKADERDAFETTSNKIFNSFKY